MTPKLYRAADVCEMTQLQPYVLRSWEKEFPGIGVQKTEDGPRLYRQADIDQVLRIKQLVFGEGLTLSGARRRMETDPSAITVAPLSIPSHQPDAPEPDDDDRLQPVDGYDELRARLASVREGLQGILDLLSGEAKPPAEPPVELPVVEEDYRLEAPPLAAETAPKVRTLTARREAEKPKKPAAVPKKKRASA
jgi:DNA-binding transcriptional MerR regulator